MGIYDENKTGGRKTDRADKGYYWTKDKIDKAHERIEELREEIKDRKKSSRRLREKYIR